MSQAIFGFNEHKSASEIHSCGSETYPRRQPCSPSSGRCNVGTTKNICLVGRSAVGGAVPWTFPALPSGQPC